MLAEYKMTSVSEVLLNSWEGIVNEANLTTTANFTFGSNILISVADIQDLKGNVIKFIFKKHS